MVPFKARIPASLREKLDTALGEGGHLRRQGITKTSAAVEAGLHKLLDDGAAEGAA